MSASPADRTPGQTPSGATPNGAAPPPKIRRQQPSNPLVRPKPRKPAQNSAAAPAKPRIQVNGAAGPPKGSLAAAAVENFGAPRKAMVEQQRAAPTSTAMTAATAIVDAPADDALASGFSGPLLAEQWRDYPLFLAAPDPGSGQRFHVARFQAKRPIDPTDEREFVRPLRLHRRDPRAPPLGAPPPADPTDPKDVAAAEEREKVELLRAQRAAQRELDMAEVAPSASLAAKQKAGKRRTQQVMRKDETEEQRAGTQLKYEEALPWHLEDFDNRQAWVGGYEAALSGTYAQITVRDGAFYITPVEKWYKFTQKRTFGKTDEEIRADLTRQIKRQKDPDFLVKQREAARAKREDDMARKMTKGLFMAAGAGASAGAPRPRIKREDEGEELDFEENEADDEEDPLFEGDLDEAKETEARIKKDQENANAFNLRDEKTYDQQEMLENLQKAAERQGGKGLRKALKKREQNWIYDSDSDHPYSESDSHSDSSKSRSDADRKSNAGDKEAKPSKPPSGASTRGNNTPSGRPGKHLDPAQRVAQASSIRRVGSPNVSDLSGSESAQKLKRKKPKTGAAGSLLGAATAANAPSGPPSRPRSPLNGGGPTSAAGRLVGPGEATGQRKGSAVLKRPRGAGGGAASGSEGEGAGSGGEMSDGSQRKRIRLNMGSARQSPSTSRAGSPERGGGAGPAGSRAASPGRASLAPPQGVTLERQPTEAEIRAAIPKEGIVMRDLLRKLGVATKGALSTDQQKGILEVIKRVSSYDKTTKLLMPAPAK